MVGKTQSTARSRLPDIYSGDGFFVFWGWFSDFIQIV